MKKLLALTLLLFTLSIPISSFSQEKKPKTKTVKAYNKKGGKHVETYHRSASKKKK